VDFCCLSARLVVELDGARHGQRATEDSERDRVLSTLGFLVLRCENSDLRNRRAHVLETIRHALQAQQLLR
jgi:very-short-patch-repair endonuclease